ncbi:tether containing UBX domain for GLUT4 [Oratosquilla oratoria]|uniref:tether containing UBX domain for GLUT4 n=1 Tax=Oratosquilla oratoria TaxID=337810 RepID=UPI003F75B4B0
MSVIVQGLNGRRATVKVTPNTSILQILEEACKKLKLDPDLYELKRGRNTVDPSSTVRFSNLPNNCKLDLVEAATPRKSSNVDVVLVTSSGERLEREFSSKCSLQEILETHEKAGAKGLLPQPDSGVEAVVVYAMRQVRGNQLTSTTLKDLGVVSGKCMLRCLQQSSTTTGQAHVGEALSRPKKTQEKAEEEDWNKPSSSFHRPVSEPAKSSSSSPSTSFSACSTITQPTAPFSAAATSETPVCEQDLPMNSTSQEGLASERGNTETGSVGLQSSYEAVREEPMEVENEQEEEEPHEEVILIGDHSAILFSLDDAPPTKVFEPSDDFFEHNITDVKRMYNEYKTALQEMEETPLQTKQMREMEKEARLLRAINQFPKTQLRIRFPDNMVIQSTFKPQNTVSDVMEFVKQFLVDSNMDFSLYTTFPRNLLNPDNSLVESELIPNARVDFVPAAVHEVYLKADTLAKKSSFRAACHAVQKKKPPKETPTFTTLSSSGLMSVSGTLRGSSSTASMPSSSSSSSSSTSKEETQQPKRQCVPGKTSNKEVPKWFKLGK